MVVHVHVKRTGIVHVSNRLVEWLLFVMVPISELVRVCPRTSWQS